MMEILVVISILAILGALIYEMSGPGREKALEGSCMSNLRQLYVGDTLYAQNSDSASAFPELNGMAYLPSASSVEMAFPDSRILWCPSVPKTLKKRLGITYASALWFNPVNADGTISLDRQLVIDREKAEGPVAHIVECTAHEEFYYAPGEKDVDNSVASPFRVFLNLDGSVTAKRVGIPRDFPLSGRSQ